MSSNLQTQLDTITNTMSGYNSAFSTINSKLPVGMIIPYPINSLALPYLLCNGSAISRTTYSALFAKLGTLYGVGDGSTTFNLPNYQACFLRGYGNQTIGSTTYNSASVGSAQNDSIIGHQHSGQSGQFLSASSTTSASTNGYASLAVQKPSSSNFGNTGGVISGGGAETAPAHHVIYYYILAQ